MNPRARNLGFAATWAVPVLAGMALVTSIEAQPPADDAPASRKVWDFQADAPGGPAQGFTTEVGRWGVADDAGNHVLAQRAKSERPVYNLALVEGSRYGDLDLSVRLRSVEGEIDQGGGLVWRAKDKLNYYIARFNPLEDNFRVYKVQNGQRVQLQSADIPGDEEWHTLRVTMTGNHITCYLDGKKHLDVEDGTFPEPGKIGLWTKADAQSHFDDLTAAP